jgi:hypothetical protein
MMGWPCKRNKEHEDIEKNVRSIFSRKEMCGKTRNKVA